MDTWVCHLTFDLLLLLAVSVVDQLSLHRGAECFARLVQSTLAIVSCFGNSDRKGLEIHDHCREGPLTSDAPQGRLLDWAVSHTAVAVRRDYRTVSYQNPAPPVRVLTYTMMRLSLWLLHYVKACIMKA